MEPGEAQTMTHGYDVDRDPGVHLTLPAKAENVAIVRHALAGLATAYDMDPDAIADLKTVVTEASMNVVVHAYQGEGPLEVRAWPEDESLVVAVRDYGVGIRPRAEPERESLRLGLSLIAALALSVEVSAPPGGGTQVVMRIPTSPEHDAETDPQGIESPEGTRLRVTAGELVAPILSRVIAMYAARADFSVDRLSDAILLSDAISSQDPDQFPDRTAQVSIAEREGAFTVRLGPLRPGGGEGLIEQMRIPELGASLEGLADEMSVQSEPDGEFLVMTVARPE